MERHASCESVCICQGTLFRPARGSVTSSASGKVTLLFLHFYIFFSLHFFFFFVFLKSVIFSLSAYPGSWRLYFNVYMLCLS